MTRGYILETELSSCMQVHSEKSSGKCNAAVCYYCTCDGRMQLTLTFGVDWSEAAASCGCILSMKTLIAQVKRAQDSALSKPPSNTSADCAHISQQARICHSSLRLYPMLSFICDKIGLGDVYHFGKTQQILALPLCQSAVTDLRARLAFVRGIYLGSP